MPSGHASRGGARWIVLWPSIITGLVLLSWGVAGAPLRDLSTLQSAQHAELVRPIAYVVLAPVCNVLDALTLLSVRQTLALIASLAVVYAVWRLVRRGRGGSLVRRIVRETVLALVALAVLVGVYAVGVLVPRPMAALRLDDPDLIAVDFHSHTNASHDGRASFTAQSNREWHAAAGFDAAYVTDHKSLAGAEAAARANPHRAGDGTVLLSGLEFVHDHNHVNVLGVTTRDFASAAAIARGDGPVPVDASHVEPVLIQTIPDQLDRTDAPSPSGRDGVLAIELSDGSPRGIDQVQRDRSAILRLADSLDLAVVAGSDNHGWGRTAVAWSVLRIPGWRALTPVALDSAIEQTVRTERRSASRVIARRSPDAGHSSLALAATLPAVAGTMFITLSPGERISWLVWTWGITAIVLGGVRRRRALHDERP
jgi:predicted metal-dependent phosphoesterase TrpH